MIIRKLRLASAALALTTSPFSVANSANRGSDQKQIGDWVIDIEPEFGSCVAVATYGSGQKFLVSYNHRQKVVKIGFTDKHADSFQPGSSRNLDFYLFRGDDLKLFSNQKFTGFAQKDGQRLIMSCNLEAKFFIDFFDKESVSFWYKNKPVSSFEIKDVHYTMGQLRNCGKGAILMSTVDPFRD